MDVDGRFIDIVVDVLSQPDVVITGRRFNKPQGELREWGVKDWVCGAVLFVQRSWFESVGGFDERFEWSHEETDLIRQAETAGLRVQSIKIPIEHSSPTYDSLADREYKTLKFREAQIRYQQKWSASA